MPDDIRRHPLPENPSNPYRLGRHVNHDEASRNYRVIPRGTVVSRSWVRRVPIFDQGDLGSCTGNAAAGWLGTDNSLRSGLTALPTGASVDEAEAVAIYSAATKLDPYPGSYPPDDTGSDGLSVTKVLKNLGLVDTYTHGFSLADCLSALQSGPVLIGIPWYDEMFYPDDNGFVTVAGQVAGGHEVCVNTLNVDQQWVGFANSWGTGWGVNGYGKMTYTTLSRLLSEDGDCTSPHALVVAPAPPGPPSPPVPPPTPPAPSWWQRFWDWLAGWFH